MNLKECAAEIKRQDTKRVADKYFSPARKIGYACPECGNGTGKDGTGATIYFNRYHYRHELKCQRCGKNFNNLEIIAHGEKLNLDDKKDLVAAVKIGCEIYGLNLDNNYSITAQNSHEQKEEIAQNSEENLPKIDDEGKESEMIHADIQAAFRQTLHA